MNSRGSYQQIKQQICFEAKPFFVGRQAHISATPSRWHGTWATWRPSRSTSATPSTAPRETPPTANLLPWSLTGSLWSSSAGRWRRPEAQGIRLGPSSTCSQQKKLPVHWIGTSDERGVLLWKWAAKRIGSIFTSACIHDILKNKKIRWICE